MATTIGELNPYRYRSYRYDTETGLYYLQSRYYDPVIGRFLNADDTDILDLTHGELLGANLYAYCSNNPVMGSDPSGYNPIVLLGVTFSLAEIVIIVTGLAFCTAYLAIPAFRNSINETISYIIQNELEQYAIIATTIISAVQSIEAVVNQQLIENATRNGNPPAKRNKSPSKKQAKEKAKRAGKDKEPIHHPKGKHGPHYHPDVPNKNGPRTPNMPNPHDHYYY